MIVTASGLWLVSGYFQFWLLVHFWSIWDSVPIGVLLPSRTVLVCPGLSVATSLDSPTRLGLIFRSKRETATGRLGQLYMRAHRQQVRLARSRSTVASHSRTTPILIRRNSQVSEICGHVSKYRLTALGRPTSALNTADNPSVFSDMSGTFLAPILASQMPLRLMTSKRNIPCLRRIRCVPLWFLTQ